MIEAVGNVQDVLLRVPGRQMADKPQQLVDFPPHDDVFKQMLAHRAFEPAKQVHILQIALLEQLFQISPVQGGFLYPRQGPGKMGMAFEIGGDVAHAAQGHQVPVILGCEPPAVLGPGFG